MQTETEILQAAAGMLLAWYPAHRRDLPWRQNRNFYTVLVSELMLQQTRVEAVKERYVAFLEKFPTEEELALASEDEVMKAWEGLGYYTRARNLQKAAKTLFAEGTPRTWVGVKRLAGVGDYTAGAISSIALGLKEPAVDGNVLRILTRLLADGSVVDDPAVKKRFTEMLREVYPDETADFCEGLMELGATVCLPNGAPLCDRCPWNTLCRAHLSGEEARYPVRAQKRARRVENLEVFVLTCNGKYALRKRADGLLKGLWEFPNRTPPPCPPPTEGASDRDLAEGASDEDSSCFTEEASDRGLAEGSAGFRILAAKRAKHVFTHVEWQMIGCLAEVAEEDPRFVWVTAEEIRREYAVPSAFKAFSQWVH